MKMCLVMILVKKVFIFSKTMIICLLCPLLCGLFFFWKGAKGELSYKEIKGTTLRHRGAKCPFLIMGFSLLNGMEFFAAPKKGIPFSIKPPAMRVRVGCYTKNYLSVYNKVVQATL